MPTTRLASLLLASTACGVVLSGCQRPLHLDAVLDNTVSQHTAPNLRAADERVLNYVMRRVQQSGGRCSLTLYHSGQIGSGEPVRIAICAPETRALWPREERRKLDRVRQGFEAALNGIEALPPVTDKTRLLEDLYAVLKNTTSDDSTEREVVVRTDLEQFSDYLTMAKIVESAAGSAHERLVGQVLRDYPPLSHPPVAVRIFLLPSKEQFEHSTPGQIQALERFFSEVIRKMGVRRVEVERL